MLLSVPGKVFAWIILDRVSHHLLEHQHPEQSGFTPKRSTIDRILALWIFTERRREFRQGLVAAYVDLCKAFKSVHLDALWRTLGLRGVPPKLNNLLSGLYSGTESAVRCGDTIADSSCYWSSSGVCTDPYTFQHLYGLDFGEDVGEIKISDLDFADDSHLCGDFGYPFGGPQGAD